MGTPRDRAASHRPEVDGDERGRGDAAPLESDAETGDPGATKPSLEGISIAGITRRRAAWLLGAAFSLWIVAVFARQVGDATAATVRADRMRASNETLSAEVAGLQRERDLIQRQAYIELAARAYGLGTAKERPFAIAVDAAPVASDAPGSAGERLGVRHVVRSPLDSWLTLLFGPANGPPADGT